MSNINTQQLEAATFQHLVQYLRDHPEVQNIDLMNLAGFCRNCLAKWYMAAAKEQGQDMNYDEAREIIYGMPYETWKNKYQKAANQQQLDAYKERNG